MSDEEGSGSPQHPEWLTMHPINLTELDAIVKQYWSTEGITRTRIGAGSSAVIYRYDAERLEPLVIRLLHPKREGISVEAEATTMRLLRSQTNLPVPEVYMYCPTALSPVGAEWIMMQFMPGKRLCDIWSSTAFTFQQKTRVAKDLACAWSVLFNIKSPFMGCIAPSIHADSLALAVPRWQGWRHSKPARWPPRRDPTDVAYSIGPLNDPAFLAEADRTVLPPPERCGPFTDEQEMLEAITFRGSPPTRPDLRIERGPGEKVLQLQKSGQTRCRPSLADVSTRISGLSSRYHLYHGDFEFYNCLVSENGQLTGILDFESTRFVPAWEAAKAPGWFDDDAERCIMDGEQSTPFDYEGEAKDSSATSLRAYFVQDVYKIDPELYYWYRSGVFERAIKDALSHPTPANAETWLWQYVEYCEKHTSNTKWWRVHSSPIMSLKDLTDWHGAEWDQRQAELKAVRHVS